MAFRPFDADQAAPARVQGREELAFDYTRTLACVIPASDLRRQRQEEFVQAAFGDKSAHQAWSALNQQELTLSDALNRLHNRVSSNGLLTGHCFHAQRGGP